MLYSICCCLHVSSLRLFSVLLFYHPITDFYAKIPALYAKIPCYLGFYMPYCARCATGRGSLWWHVCVLGLMHVFNQA